MSVIFTQEYLASAPHADLEVTYPDGVVWNTRALADGNGSFVAGIRDAIAFGRASHVAGLAHRLDDLRKSHADAARRGKASSAWALSHPHPSQTGGGK